MGAPHDGIEGFANLSKRQGEGFAENKKTTYGCTSEDIRVVEVGEDFNNEFCGGVLKGGSHAYGRDFQRIQWKDEVLSWMSPILS